METMRELTLTEKLMRFLAAGDGDAIGAGDMVASNIIANVFDVNEEDVIYLLKHHADMGRLSQQETMPQKRGKKRFKFCITMKGRQWLESKGIE